MTWVSPKKSRVDLFISEFCDGIEKVRRFDVPVDFILGNSINITFIRYTIWKSQGIN